MPLVLEGAAHQRDGEGLEVGAGVGEDEVLSAGLADEARVGAVARDVLADAAPHRLEHARRAGEVHAREIGVVEAGVGDGLGRAHDQVDDAVGEARFAEGLHHEVGGVERVGRGLPHHGVAHQRGGRGEVPGDGGEVERRAREDEALERAGLEQVPDPRAGDGLLGGDLPGEVHVEAEEIHELAGGVDLGLVRGLALAEHRRGADGGAEARGQEIGGLEEHGGPRRPRQRRPAGVGALGGGDGLRHVLHGALVRAGEEQVAAVGRAHVLEVARRHLFAVDEHRDLDRLGGAPAELGLERGALRAAGGVVERGLVGRVGRGDDGVEHGGAA